MLNSIYNVLEILGASMKTTGIWLDILDREPYLEESKSGAGNGTNTCVGGSVPGSRKKNVAVPLPFFPFFPWIVNRLPVICIKMSKSGTLENL